MSTPTCDVHVRLKTKGIAILKKIAKETTDNQDKKYNWVKHYSYSRREVSGTQQQFSKKYLFGRRFEI